MEIEKNKEEYKKRDKKSQEDVDFWQDKCTKLEKQNREFKSENQRLIMDLEQSKQLQLTTAKVILHKFVKLGR